MPAAIGGTLACSSTPVVALVGDAGFQFTVPELGVAVELDLHLIIVLWNNDALGQIRDGIIKRGIEEIGVVCNAILTSACLPRPTASQYLQPGEQTELADGLSRAMAEPGPRLIDARQDAFS